ncbi:MAG TPA: cytochrome b [Micavibrio sp.]|nr:cytochrome b [Micavibrio sp.]
MSERQGSTFGFISRFNHWTVALVFIGMLCLGFYLEFGGLEREAKGPLMGIHKSVGTLFLVFALWRVLWRIVQGFPQDIAVFPAWQKISARIVHWLLLLSVIAMPLSGALMSLFNGRDIDIFGWFRVPAQDKNELISGIAHEIHGTAPYIIVALILLHLGAAIKHQFIDGDRTLGRMLGSR